MTSFKNFKFYDAHEYWEDLWSDYHLKDAKFIQALVCSYHSKAPDCRSLPKNILAALKYATTIQHYSPAGTLKDTRIYAWYNRTQKGGGLWGYKALGWNVTSKQITTKSIVSKGTQDIFVLPPPHHMTTIIWKAGGHPGFGNILGFSPPVYQSNTSIV